MHYLVKLTKDTGEVRYIRTRGATGVEHTRTVQEGTAYRYPSETEAKEAAGQYEGKAWTVEVVEVDTTI